MNTFSEELQKERLAKNIALADIAASTHISIKYLEALEQGSFDVLPQTYIRAFIREYALSIGLSPNDVLHRYDVLVTRKFSQTEDSPWSESQFSQADAATISDRTPQQAGAELIKQHNKRRAFVLAGIGVLIIAVIYFAVNYLSEEKLLRSAKETPFQQVVQEQEGTLVPQEANAVPATTATAPQDSVELVGTTTDSVWMAVSMDENPPQEFLFLPKQTHTWKAREKFIITLGNAGGIRLSVNGKDIGVLGKRGEVVRNITITPRSAQH